jgi:hypothetical protein
MKLAYVTLTRDDASPIMSKNYQECVKFWKISWEPQHVVFYNDVSDDLSFIAYRADKIIEISTYNE